MTETSGDATHLATVHPTGRIASMEVTNLKPGSRWEDRRSHGFSGI